MDKNMNTWVKEITLNKEVQPMPIMTYPGLELMSENILDRPSFAGEIGPFSLTARLLGIDANNARTWISSYLIRKNKQL